MHGPIFAFWMRLAYSYNAEASMNRKPEKVKKGIFRQFWPIFRCFSGTQPKFHQNFCSDWYHYIFQNRTHWYFYQKIILRWLKKVATLDIQSDKITILVDSKTLNGKRFVVSSINKFQFHIKLAKLVLCASAENYAIENVKWDMFTSFVWNYVFVRLKSISIELVIFNAFLSIIFLIQLKMVEFAPVVLNSREMSHFNQIENLLKSITDKKTDTANK